VLFGNQHRKVRFLFSLADVVLTALAFEAAYRTRALLHVLPNEFYFRAGEKALLMAFCVLVFVAAGYWLDVHGRLHASDPWTILRDTFLQAGSGTLSLVVFQYVLRLDLSRMFLLLFALDAWILLLIFRLQAVRFVSFARLRFGATRYVLVAGLGECALRIAESLERAQGIRLRGFLAVEDDGERPLVQLSQSYPVYRPGELRSMLRQHVIDEIIFAVGAGEIGRLRDVFLVCDEEGVRTRVTLDFFPHANSQMRLERFGPTPLLTFAAAPDDEIKLLAKRAIDIVLAAVGLLLAAPLMLLTAAAIRLTSPGPVIFRQDRCGLNGRQFVCFKFRSMVADAERRKAEVIHMSRRTTATKIPNDPRLTPIGGFLRRFSIDELPQLFNVLKGDMSLVGPRPAIPSEVAVYESWQRRRLRARPGLTCLWAVQGRDTVDFETWMKMDLQYLDSWSLGLDLRIILRTIPTVVLGKGAN
jgi:exopolysaccharide biosynthesis polyprenyl glycosylphosphotransferase